MGNYVENKDNFTATPTNIVEGVTTLVTGFNGINQTLVDNINYLKDKKADQDVVNLKTDTGYVNGGVMFGLTFLESDTQYLAGDGFWYKLKATTTSPYTHDASDTPDTDFLEKITHKTTSDKVENLSERIYFNLSNGVHTEKGLSLLSYPDAYNITVTIETSGLYFASVHGRVSNTTIFLKVNGIIVSSAANSNTDANAYTSSIIELVVGDTVSAKLGNIFPSSASGFNIVKIK